MVVNIPRVPVTRFRVGDVVDVVSGNLVVSSWDHTVGLSRMVRVVICNHICRLCGVAVRDLVNLTRIAVVPSIYSYDMVGGFNSIHNILGRCSRFYT